MIKSERRIYRLRFLGPDAVEQDSRRQCREHDRPIADGARHRQRYYLAAGTFGREHGRSLVA